jgi:hypothetical protein
MIKRWIAKLISKYVKKPAPPVEPTWRRDVDEIHAVDGKIRFHTRCLSIPTGNGLNADGGFEWIIARIHGSGYNRLLIMVMGGNRSPARIYMQTGGDAPFWDSRWPMPLTEPASWEVSAYRGTIRIVLNGSVIWERAGGYTVDRAIMHDSPNRRSNGEWSVAQ